MKISVEGNKIGNIEGGAKFIEVQGTDDVKINGKKYPGVPDGFKGDRQKHLNDWIASESKKANDIGEPK